LGLRCTCRPAKAPIDWYDPAVELAARIAGAWLEADRQAENARDHRANARRYWLDIWQRRDSRIGPIERRLDDPNVFAWGLVLVVLEQRREAIVAMRRAIAYAISLEAQR
jgi:hypothetical protein